MKDRSWIWLCLVVGALSFWQITEQDIYWQIRAGSDLWTTWEFPMVDSWSFSGRGNEWMNIQWLTTLFFYAIYSLGQEPALVLARAIGVAALFGFLAHIKPRRSALVLVPLFFLAIAFRLQLRADLFIFVALAALVWLWSSSKIPVPARLGWTFGFLFLSVQLHPGTAPFLFVFVAQVLLHLQISLKRKGLLFLALGALFFVTPYHFHVLPILERHLNYYQHNIMQNPDHQPLNLGHFMASGLGLAAWVFTLLVLTAPLVWWWLRKNFENIYSKGTFFFPLWILLTMMSANRIRSVPFLLIFLYPVFAQFLKKISEGAIRKIAITSFALVLVQLWVGRFTYGLGASRDMFPVDSVDFIKREKPATQLLHTYAYGAYTVWNLKDYGVFVDTRESPYLNLQQRILDAFYSASQTQKLCRDFQIGTVLYPLPKTGAAGPNGILRNLNTEYFPKEEWALVYVGGKSNVLVRRQPENQRIISNYEYRVLDTGYPPSIYSKQTGYAADPERLGDLKSEIARCLAENPNADYCLLAKAAMEL